MRRMHHFLASIRKNEQIAENYFRLEFDWPAEYEPPLPGQFLTIRAKESKSPLLRRPFALSGFDPVERSAEIIYEKRGEATANMTHLREGVDFDVIAPLGNSFPLPQPGSRPVLLAGGVGMGPLFFFAEYLVTRGLAPLLIVGARNSALIPDLPVFRLSETLLATDDGTRGFRGNVIQCLGEQVHQKKLQDRLELYACGPFGMMKAAAAWAIANNCASWSSVEQTMGCAVGACMGCVIPVHGPKPYARVCTEGPIFESAQIDWETPHV